MSPATFQERLVTKRELARRLGVTTRTLDKWIAAGKIPAATVRMSRKSVNWRESEVLHIIENLSPALQT
jgi:excisionase family DNA binding protein